MTEEEPFQPDPRDKLAFRTAYLIAGYIQESLTSREHQELDDWVSDSLDNQLLFEELTDENNLHKLIEWKDQLPVEQVLQRLKSQVEFSTPTRHFRFRTFLPYSIAAAVLALIVLSILFFQKHITENKQNTPVQIVKGITPGGNHAILTLSNGSTIRLDSADNGNLAKQGNTNIIKQQNGQISYELIKTATLPAPIEFNTLTTPIGGQYQLVLPDGTKVWLNAASSLRYPASFAGNERKVELAGEGYFEVAKDAIHPFTVSSNGTTVQVLGTHFNINAYPDEPAMKVTLAEGSIKVGQSVVLKPGQQAQVNQHGSVRTIAANLETTLAWKDGLFNFKETPIEDIMRQVSRWYDAAVIYQSKPTEHFNAIVSRSEPITKLLHLLEQTGSVHFKIEKKNITIMK